VALDSGMGFQVPPGAQLVVRISYRKTWQYERRAMTDRSSVGLYFADPSATDVHVLRALSPSSGDSAATFGTTIPDDLRAVAVYADPDVTGLDLTVVAVRPDSSREELIAFQPRADWARRYWFREPISLPRGTRIQVTAARAADAIPPAAAPAAPRVSDGPLSLALDVVTAR
jgi:hypothetical protein